MEKNYTKAEKYEMIKTILGGVEGDNVEMLIEFVENEQAALGRKAAKAKEKAAERKTEVDDLGNAVLAVLTAEPASREDIFNAVEFDDITIAKVGARLTRLVDLGLAVRDEVKATSASGKKTTRKVYSLAPTEAAPVDAE